MKNCTFSLLAIVIIICSCSNPRYIHSPSVHNAAFLRQQGDFKFTVAGAVNPETVFEDASDTGGGEESYGFDGQAAVAVTDHFFIAGGGYIRREEDRYGEDDLEIVSTGTRVGYKRSMFDIGAGLYTPMGQSDRVYFNGLLGVGFGKMEIDDVASAGDALRARKFDANFTKFNIHPSFNFFFNDYLRMSVAPKFSIMKLNKIESTYSALEEQSLGYDEARENTFGLFEPAILLQTGFRGAEWLKLDFGFNFSSDPFTTNNDDGGPTPESDTYNVKSRNFLFSLGLSFYPQARRR